MLSFYFDFWGWTKNWLECDGIRTNDLRINVPALYQLLSIIVGIPILSICFLATSMTYCAWVPHFQRVVIFTKCVHTVPLFGGEVTFNPVINKIQIFQQKHHLGFGPAIVRQILWLGCNQLTTTRILCTRSNALRVQPTQNAIMWFFCVFFRNGTFWNKCRFTNISEIWMWYVFEPRLCGEWWSYLKHVTKNWPSKPAAPLTFVNWSKFTGCVNFIWSSLLGWWMDGGCSE